MGNVLSNVVDHLVCPICTTRLELAGRSVRCARQHSFDVARQGYVNLLPGGARTGTADTAAMVEARASFLAEGHFASLAGLLADHVAAITGDRSCVLDAGTGTGYYLATALDRSPGAVGAALDISKYAARRAARAHPRIGALVWDLWQTFPVRSGGVSAVLNIFAPHNAAEFHRVLRPDGALFLVTPTSNHLHELVRPLGLLSIDDGKAGRVDAALNGYFRRASQEAHETVLLLTHASVEALAGMGPSAWHVTKFDVRRRLSGRPDPLRVTASFTLSVYRPDGQGGPG